MEGIAYFPGCSLKDTARRFEASAMFVMETLGLPLVELDRWNCCGTVFSLTDDDLMHHIASVRNFVRAKEMGSDEIVALCSMCYNTLRRVADRINVDEESRTKINDFMDREEDYEGDVSVAHLLEVLRDRLGWDAVSDAVTRPLMGLRVAGYYGCTLVRPKSAAIDDGERPTVLADAMEAVGAEGVPFAFQTECCGTYQAVDRPDLSIERSYRVIRSAREAGADLIVTACPLCQFNLEEALKQEPLEEERPIAVAYFTEVLAMALGWNPEEISESLRELVAAHVPTAQEVRGVPAEGGA